MTRKGGKETEGGMEDKEREEKSHKPVAERTQLH